MKKIFILFIVMFSFGFVKANPVVPPPVISEFYLINDSTWYLELVFLQPYYFYPNLDGFQIISSSGTSPVKNGISITPDNILVLTQDSLQNLLHFIREGDFIFIESPTGIIDQIIYGSIPGSLIAAPLPGQSLVNFAFQCIENSEWTTTYHLVTDNDPTIGSSPFQPSEATGTFMGFVFDNEHHPVPGIYIGNSLHYDEPPFVCGNFFESTISQSDGSFSILEYSGRYPVEIFFQPSYIFTDSVINIEPDSNNYFEFTLDTLFSGIDPNSFNPDISFSCYPNPTTGETTISFPSGTHFTKAIIKIYQSNGEIIRILPVNTLDSQNRYSVKWDGLGSNNLVPSGIYYFHLELDGRKVATSKIIIAR